MTNQTYIESLKSVNLEGTQSLRIIIAGGGTGGHIFPAIAIANALKKLRPFADILFVGALGKMEMDKVPKAGYKIIGLHIAGFNRSSILKNITLPFKLARSFYEVRKILAAFKPIAVIGVGGYSSFPVLKLAQRQKIPTYIHEANSFAGKSNILLGKNANKVFVASYGMEKFFPQEKLLLTGNPVRNDFVEGLLPKEEAVTHFGLNKDLKTVLVIGGSLGASSINEVIKDNIKFFRQNNLQLIWQTGKGYANQAASIEGEEKNIWTAAFIENMALAYAASDIVISRSGAMAVSELCIVAKPVIFIPYPHAAEDHQTVNANALVQKRAALLVRDSELKEKLFKILEELISNDPLAQELKTNIADLANSNADELIASEILKDLNA